MSSTATLCGAEAAPHTITHGGREYRFRTPDESATTEFSRWLTDRKRDHICQMFPPGPDRNERLDQLIADAMAGAYDYDSEAAKKARVTEAGLVKMASICAACTEVEMLSLLRAKGDEVAAVMKLVTAEYLGISPAELDKQIEKDRRTNAGGGDAGDPEKNPRGPAA